jgi:oligoribonuclease (3'-5' exoribonuclease)
MKHRLFVDLETTGLKPDEGSVVLSGCFILDRVDADVNSEMLEFVIQPTEEEFANASPKALEVNGFTWELLQETGVPRPQAIQKILSWILQHNITHETTEFIGQNPKFDQKFLWHLMPQELEFACFPRVSTDVIDLAKELASKDPNVKFPSFHGAGISRGLGIEEEGELHLARGGAESCRRNYYEIWRRMQHL